MEGQADTQPLSPPPQPSTLIAADASPSTSDARDDVDVQLASDASATAEEPALVDQPEPTIEPPEAVEAPEARSSSEETVSIREALEDPAHQLDEPPHSEPEAEQPPPVEVNDVPPPTPAKSVEPPEQPAPPPPPPLPPLPEVPHIIHPTANGAYDSRAQSPAPSLSVAGSSNHNSHKRSMTTARGSNMSIVLISSALETIAASKEAKRSAALRDGIQNALELVKTNQAIDHPREILEPLRLACETQNEKLVIASLDCISKLVSYSFFAEDNEDANSGTQSPPQSPNPNGRRSSLRGSHPTPPQPSLVDLVAATIFSCHNETTSDTVSVQIVKALLGLVLSQTTVVHHHSLLQSVRTVFNIYMLSATPQIQMLAQGSLTQMVDHVFNRCKMGQPTLPVSTPRRSEDSLASFKVDSNAQSSPPPLPVPVINEPSEGKAEESNGVGEGKELPVPSETKADESTESTNGAATHSQLTESSDEAPLEAPPAFTYHLTTRDHFLKDAFLIFRALCKLSMKPIPPEDEQDPKAHAYRHKVMAIQLILHILNSHMTIVVDPTSIIYSSTSQEAPTFVQQITPHLCTALSRNAVSPVPQVFELSVEIFWRVLSGMRTKLKKEIEVLLHEIFIPILEMKTATLKQKAVILAMLSRLCQDPQALVEIYLNYDCDPDAVDNIYEHLMNIISKFVKSSGVPHHGRTVEPTSPGLSPTTHKNQAHSSNSLNAGVLAAGTVDSSSIGLSEAQLKRQALDCLLFVLRSLVTWGIPATSKTNGEQVPPPRNSTAGDEGRRDTPSVSDRLGHGSTEALRISTPEPADDPTRFETAKQRKTTLLEGIKKFNFKPKRGIQFLTEHGFIPDSSPTSIARFLHETDGLNKSMLGEYLGDGDDEHLAIMHAFVDMIDFRDTPFVDSIRTFLQAFRLPGEAQKIDRFMLKFAERYINGNAKTPFANADTAYILGYSVIMLNTDAHSPQVKKRMTKQEFMRNNRGINDGGDLPEELLSSIYDDIVQNEIVMNDEIEAKLLQQQGSLASTLGSVGRDLQKEAYVIQTSGMSNKTETLLNMMRSQRKNSKADQFFSASHFVHVRPMFEVAWMPFLAGLSGPLQETDDLEVVEACLEGMKHAIHIVCFFDLDLQRDAFVTTLAKFTFLNNLGEMKTKNMEAIKTLLDVAVNEGNYLKTSWREVLTCVSQLEHMQLIGSGFEDGAKGRSKRVPNEELANQSRSTHITVAADMVFSLSHYLSGTAIVEFVRALCSVSWDEIQSSGKSDHPRLFSLQKLVDISYYNMGRIRMEWSNLWELLGDHFNRVCCHPNVYVASFALDALRQLAVRFLEKEELPHFKFQKDFLKPFEYTMAHNQNADIKDMVLQCLLQMIQAKVHNLRSGWRTMFGVFSAAAKVYEERIVVSAFEIVKRVNRDHFPSIVRHGAFADLTVCITEFCKIGQYQKISLTAIAMLRDTIPVMLESPECGLSKDFVPQNPEQTLEDSMMKFWFPVLFGFYDIIMNSDDLEVRRLALDSLFSALKTYGTTFPMEFWSYVCQKTLFPIFAILKNKNDMSRFNSQGDISVWLQSTMFQALRSLIDLYTFHFAILENVMFDGLLDLLVICVCQENKVLSQIGTSCLQQLLESNVARLSAERWDKVTSTFAHLFRSTTPHQLFDENLRAETLSNSAPSESGSRNGDENDSTMILPAPLSPNLDQSHQDKPMTAGDRQQIFSQIIIKCILQLLLIEMTSELINTPNFYNTIPADQLLKVVGILSHSYQFARMFNDDKQLRTELWKVGFMKHLPNLLKQESTSASTLIHVLLRMYFDSRQDYRNARPQIAERLLPLGLGVLDDYNKLQPSSQAKNILAWNPVIAEFMDGFSRLDDKAFSRYLPVIYLPAVELLSRDVPYEIREALKAYFLRVGKAQGIIEASL